MGISKKNFFAAMTGACAVLFACGDTTTLRLDTRTEPLEVDSIVLPWNATWIGGNAGATVAISDNGVEVRRVTGAGEFTHTLAGAGRHELTYTTYIGGAAQGEVYTAVVYKRSISLSGASCAVALEDSVYDGQPKEATVTVVVDGTALGLGSDYSLSYLNNVNAGTAKVIVSGRGNYTGAITNTFTIARRTLTVKAAAKSKTYGAADPALTYTVTGLVGSDAMSGALARDAGENVGTYAIRQGTLTAGNNYTISYTGANLKINRKTLTVKAAAKSKTYGSADPALTYTVTGLVGSDAMSGALARDAGEAVGTYAIRQGTLTAGNNYTISYTGANLTITRATLPGGGSGGSGDFGGEEPGGGSAPSGGLSKFDATAVYDGQGHTIDAEALAAAFAGAMGDGCEVAYALDANGSPDAATWSASPHSFVDAGGHTVWYKVSNPNYDDYLHAAKVTVTPKALTVKAAAKSKTYGSSDPALTYTATGLVGTDAMSGALARDAGENVGTYAIRQGTLTAGDNYAISYTGANLKINRKTLTIRAAAKSKAYGAADPVLTYTVTGLVGSDTVGGSLTRDAGEAVGTYAIRQGTLTAGNNYTISYIGANLTITSAALPGGGEEPGGGSVPEGGESKFDATAVYDGQGHTIDAEALAAAFADAMGDGCEVAYALDANGSPDASTWASSPESFVDAGEYFLWYRVSNPNYDNFLHAAKVTVTPKSLTVRAAAKSKTYGASDPALTYTATGLVGSDAVSGSLARDAGENVGTYAIRQGTLTAGDNYAISYTGANLTISRKALTVRATAKTKVYGSADPALTYTVTGLVGSDAMSGSLVRDAGEVVGTYAIRLGTLTAGNNYTINFTGANLTITRATGPGGGGSGGEEPGSGSVPEGGLSKFDATAVYDGRGHTIDAEAIAAAFTAAMGGACEVAYALDANGSPDAATWASSPESFVDAGEYTVWYKVSNQNYEDYLHAAKVTVTPKALAVRADAKTKVYGAADPALTYTATGLVGSDAMSGALTRDAGENVGTYAIRQGTLAAGDNYTVSYTGANLTITKATLPGGGGSGGSGGSGGAEPGGGTVPEDGLSKFDATFLYDGQGHTFNVAALLSAFNAAMGGGCSVQYALDADGAADAATWSTSPHLFVNAGEHVAWYRVTSRNYQDFVHAAKVTVAKRQVTLSSVSAGGVFDGTPLVAPYVDVGGDGFAPGEGAYYDVTGSRTEVGSSPNTFTYTLWENTLPGNYDIVCAEGTLVVTYPPSPVYRFYSPRTKGHFFTMNEGEKNNLIATASHIWNYEGIAYYAYPTQIPGTGTVPLYRFWSPGARGHFFTRNEGEKDNLIATASHIWNYEGIAYYVAASRMPGTVPVYRFWAPGAKHHFYTLNEGEKNSLIANASHIWNYEGIAFFAWPTRESANSRNATRGREEAAGSEEADEGKGRNLPLSTSDPCPPMSTDEQGAANGDESGDEGVDEWNGADGAAPSRDGADVAATSAEGFSLVAMPGEDALPDEGVAEIEGIAVEIRAGTPGDGVFASELDEEWNGGEVALRLLLPEGVFSISQLDEESGGVVNGDAEGAMDFELPASGAWYLLRVLDEDGAEVYSRWMKAE